MANLVFSPDDCGNARVYFQNKKLRSKINAHMRDMNEVIGAALVFAEQLEDELTPSQLRDFNAGYDVVMRVDPWSAAHYWGYDAQTVFE